MTGAFLSSAFTSFAPREFPTQSKMSAKIRQLVAGEDIGRYGANIVEVLVQQRLHLCQQHLVVVQRLPGVFIAAEKVDGNSNDDWD